MTPAVASASSSDGHDPAQVGPRRDLGHDAAGRRVERDLAGDDVGVDPPAVLDQGDAGLVAAGLDREEQRAAHATPSPAGRAAGLAGAGRVAGRDRVVRARRRAAGAASSAARSRAIRSRIAGDGQRLGRHDQRVFLVVAVVARAGCPTGRKPYFSYSRRAARFDSRTSRVASRAWRSTDEVQQREQQPLPDPAAAVARVDGEGRDVGLVDHQPDAAVGRRPRPPMRADEVVGEPVASRAPGGRPAAARAW